MCVYVSIYIWLMEHSQRLSPTVKCMLKLKPLLKNFMLCHLVNGRNVSFWYDHWCALGPLAELLGSNGPRQLCIRKDATVNEAVRNGEWWMSAARS